MTLLTAAILIGLCVLFDRRAWSIERLSLFIAFVCGRMCLVCSISARPSLETASRKRFRTVGASRSRCLLCYLPPTRLF